MCLNDVIDEARVGVGFPFPLSQQPLSQPPFLCSFGEIPKPPGLSLALLGIIAVGVSLSEVTARVP